MNENQKTTPTAEEIARETARIAALPIWEFDLCGDSQLTQALSEASRLLAESKLTDSPRWLTLSGPRGVGKTHLAKKVHHFWRAKYGLVAHLFKWAELISLDEHAAGYVETHMQNTPYLTIDGVELLEASDLTLLLNLLKHRRGKWTMLTIKTRGLHYYPDLLDDGNRHARMNCRSYADRWQIPKEPEVYSFDDLPVSEERPLDAPRIRRYYEQCKADYGSNLSPYQSGVLLGLEIALDFTKKP